MKFLRDLNFGGMRVFVRADLDVPIQQLTVHSSQLTDSTRLLSLKPTFDYIRSHGAKQIIIAGKIGRPKGKVDLALSTRHIKGALEKILGQKIEFWQDFGGPVSSFPPASAHSNPESSADQLDNPPLRAVGSPSTTATPIIVLLENMHFWPEELEPNEEFAKKLAELADVYVNENFASAHRNEATQILLPKLLPHAAGLHLEKEVNQLTELIRVLRRPFVAVIGGAKIETKIPVIENLSHIADFVLVGGCLPLEIEKEGRKFGQNVVIAETTDNLKDISKGSVQKFEETLKGAKTVVWNGPMGLFEEGFDEGTKAVTQAIIESGAYSVVGGGDTVEFLSKEGMLSKFSFVSNGGGSMLEFLAGHELPGLAALG